MSSPPKSAALKAWKKGKPEVSIEWLDVTIDIKVCGADIPAEDRGFVRLFPELDPNLLSKDQIDMNRLLFRKERKKLQKFEYKLVPNKPTKEVTPKVLPKLTCDHCGKSFSRRSTLEQHLASHDTHNTSWEDVQDAALQDLEKAIVFEKTGGVVPYNTFTNNMEDLDLSREDEEEEIPAPQESHNFRCPTCNKVFSKNKYLQKHMKIHTGVKPYSCDICGWRFLQNHNLKKHMWSHSQEKPNKCVDCLASFPNAAGLRDHVMKYHDQEELEFLETELETGNSPPRLISCPFPKCGRKFAAKPHLDRHMPVHSNMAKPYECEICGWKFHLQHNMDRHMQTHETGKKAKVPPHKRVKQNINKSPKKKSDGQTTKKTKADGKRTSKDSTPTDDDDSKTENAGTSKPAATKTKVKEFSNDFSDEDELLDDEKRISDDDELGHDDEDELLVYEEEPEDLDKDKRLEDKDKNDKIQNKEGLETIDKPKEKVKVTNEDTKEEAPSSDKAAESLDLNGDEKDDDEGIDDAEVVKESAEDTNEVTETAIENTVDAKDAPEALDDANVAAENTAEDAEHIVEEVKEASADVDDTIKDAIEDAESVNAAVNARDIADAKEADRDNIENETSIEQLDAANETNISD